ncbi:hypothetical protein BL250_12535 [Erwinia sp. OLTSP20]|uniref:pirin family protein n=1 Tax=unclassified Erwinia TaxID=2622719 RepID=UPI000C19EB2D|nr:MULTISPECIES: pirin family protein [unclassified Erwinia]PIJ50217.1 hypothetical protein BV501_09045 [Erwinia sp. OAMSP11]PIJ72054.1 hypothetical protein BK416_09945 [Erwinia sp. OLSSP12]PIJ81345.1 hypothetical protein BLD47_08770 [Erwinia sp. OLCASP19]PIJ84051.1 hypothetical protein BLD46_08350 [Erwinia sp. OLMTSP26]PIJ85750.1 hypothetical protein BLD49_09570 [Erwinia sp. OLMDSP33]
MITGRAASECGKADYGWLQARYTFSFGHYFDPKLLGYASLRVLNQEVLAPGASFQPRTYPNVDVLNIILQGEAEYRDSEGNHCVAQTGEALLLATQPGVSYSEHNLDPSTPLTRMQLWLDACPQRENKRIQRISTQTTPCFLLASPDGENGSLQLRQQVWIHHLTLAKGQQHRISLRGPRAYLQSIHGALRVQTAANHSQPLRCGDGAFIGEESQIELLADTPGQMLIVDLPL